MSVLLDSTRSWQRCPTWSSAPSPTRLRTPCGTTARGIACASTASADATLRSSWKCSATGCRARCADVHVLVDHAGEADGKLSIPAERAVELRNRKERQLVLMVPVGSGSAASSLDNSFARIDVTLLLAAAAERAGDDDRGRRSPGRRPPGGP